LKSIDHTDYIILYAPEGQSGETVFLSDTQPTVETSDAPNLSSSFSNGTLTVTYTAQGSHFVPITIGNQSIVVVLMTKAIANTWHAPLISSNEGAFANFFSIGTNETYVLHSLDCIKMNEVMVFLVQCPSEWTVRSAIRRIGWKYSSSGNKSSLNLIRRLTSCV
jgi:hypothetical protein